MNTRNEVASSMQETINDTVKDIVKGLGKINIIIAGKTGVGKSTLINSVFRGELAKTGSGQPVTQRTEEITKDGHPITIIDTKGLELEDYKKIHDELDGVVSERSKNHDENEHIHIAWLCIHEDGRRVEVAEQTLCEMFSKHKIPVVVVITKTRSDNGFRDEVIKMLPTAASVVSVRAIQEEIEDGDDVITLKERGIDKLIDETAKLIPDAKKRAFANSLSSKHQSAMKIKINQAENEVNIATGLAGTAAAIPVPFSDAFTLVPIQVGMLAKISVTFGMEASTAALTTLITSIAGAGAATMIGRTLVTGLLKMIPGAGSVAGGAIAAATAIALTKALGAAYISVLVDLSDKNPGKNLDMDLIAKELKKKMSF